ncbi:hypothetical protein ABPG74_007528 [Tetrahymena malaccensis]
MQLVEQNNQVLESFLKSEYNIYKYSPCHYLNEHDQIFVNSFYFLKHILDNNSSVAERSRKIQQLTLNNDQNMHFISHGILYHILLCKDNEQELFQYLKMIRTQAMEEFINKLIWIQQFEFDDLKDQAVYQLGAILETLLKYNEMFRLDEVFFYYLKNIIQGDFSERNLTYFSKIITLIYDNIESIKTFQAINILVFFKTIKLLNIFMYVDDPMLSEYKQIMILIIQVIWNHDKIACLSLGRDLVRLLSDTNKDELEQITKDLLTVQPNGDTLLDMLIKNVYVKKEQKYFIYSVLIPCKLEYMLEPMLNSNSSSANEYRLKWIMKQYKTPESNIQFLFVDIIRFLIQNNNQQNPNFIDCKPQIFLWALNNSENLDLIKSQIKEAIFHDWLFYNDQDDFKPIISGLQFINCLKEPKIIQEMLEFILLYYQKFNPAQTDKYRSSIRKCFLIGQQEKFIKIEDILMRVSLSDIKKEIRQLLDNTPNQANQIYELSITNNLPIPSQSVKLDINSSSDDEIYTSDNTQFKVSSRQKFDDDDDDNDMNEEDSSNFYNPSDVHNEVQNQKYQYQQFMPQEPKIEKISSKYKNVRGYDPLNVETPYRFNDSESTSNDIQQISDIYNPNDIKPQDNQTKQSYAAYSVTCSTPNLEEEIEEQLEPQYDQIDEEIEELEITDQAEMYLPQEFYSSFSDEINLLAQNPCIENLQEFLNEFIRQMKSKGNSKNEAVMIQSAAVLIYNVFQSHFDDLNILIQDNACLEIINLLADAHRKESDSEYKIMFGIFEQLNMIHNSMVDFLFIQLSATYLQKDKQVVLASLKKIYLSIVSKDNQNSSSKIQFDVKEEINRIYLILGPKNFQTLIKNLVINSFDVVFLNFMFMKSVCLYCSSSFIISELVPIITNLKLFAFTSDLNQTFSKAFAMVEYEQDSFWRIYESYLLTNIKKPQIIENVIKEILIFLSDPFVQIDDNLPFWGNLSSFLSKFLKQNKDITIMNLFIMDTTQGEKFGFLLKNADQAVLLGLFKKFLASEAFNPQCLPSLIQNCMSWKKYGIKFNQQGFKEFFEPKLYNKLSQHLQQSELKQYQTNLMTLQIQQ